MILLLGCGLFGNSAPKLVSINNEPLVYFLGIPVFVPSLDGAVGEDLPIFLEIDDAEGDAVDVWFPDAPGGFEFDHTATSGVWHVPMDPPTRYVRRLHAIVLADHHPTDPRQSEYELQIALDGLETGETAYVPETAHDTDR